jgi:hypothetical protein
MCYARPGDCGGQPGAGLLSEPLPKETFVTTSTAQLGAEYRRLKRRKCTACARFGSDFHQLLRVLGERLDGQSRPTLH